MKYELKEEPSDATLLTALDALHLEGAIAGKPMRGGTANGSSRLVELANIQITAQGRKQLQEQTAPTVAPSAVVHGDQIINYGHAGAIGRQSIGTINHQQQWAATANQVDLSQVVGELQTLKTELMKKATKPADFQQLGLIAEAEEYAEKQDGPKVMEVLSKSGKWLFDFATAVGTDVTAKLVAKATGLEP